MESSLPNFSFDIPPLIKILASILTILYFIGSIFPSSKDFFALVPGYTIPPHFYIWNIITAGYLETSFLSLVVDILVLVTAGKYLESVWGGPRELLKFIFLVNALTGLSTFLLLIFLYAVRQNDEIWFSPHWTGFSAVIAGFSVAFKQLLPDHEIKFLFAFTLRTKYLPGLLLLVNLIFLILGIPLQSFPFMIFGLLFSWIYLRFFQRRNEVIGDMNESFSFASFFPEYLQPFASTISRIFFIAFSLCNCLPLIGQPYGERLTTGYVLSGISTSDPADVERRRARALRVLDQRMQQQQHSNQSVSDIANNTKKLTDSDVV